MMLALPLETEVPRMRTLRPFVAYAATDLAQSVVGPPVSTLGEITDHFREYHFSIACLEPALHRDSDPALCLGIARPFREEI